ncbi:hypothetical protein RJJ37_07365 [Rhizobium redzepovicii]|uniref:Uncharacterized protein n=1 Tax=Rhizobium redzepovicii TaxID=2867518 RepID=A0AAW8NZQ8_9HYPH|nr:MULTISPECIES: hypothetical protein [Rhizobium]MBB3522183.1 hypothetical protein [Rhizobium sp. BK456]MDR9759450.1 hypothetical protein [Rhizobium redzepovicii]
MYRKKINIFTVMAGQRLDVAEVDDGVWLVSFTRDDLGYIDLERRTLQTIESPFGTRLSPMSWGRSITYVSGMERQISGTMRRTRMPDNYVTVARPGDTQ